MPAISTNALSLTKNCMWRSLESEVPACAHCLCHAGPVAPSWRFLTTQWWLFPRSGRPERLYFTTAAATARLQSEKSMVLSVSPFFFPLALPPKKADQYIPLPFYLLKGWRQNAGRGKGGEDILCQNLSKTTCSLAGVCPLLL